jgi:hypothetical protein
VGEGEFVVSRCVAGREAGSSLHPDLRVSREPVAALTLVDPDQSVIEVVLLYLFLRQQYLRWISQVSAGLEYSQSEPRLLSPPRSEINDVGLSSAISRRHVSGLRGLLSVGCFRIGEDVQHEANEQ